MTIAEMTEVMVNQIVPVAIIAWACWYWIGKMFQAMDEAAPVSWAVRMSWKATKWTFSRIGRRIVRQVG